MKRWKSENRVKTPQKYFEFTDDKGNTDALRSAANAAKLAAREFDALMRRQSTEWHESHIRGMA